MTAAEIWRATNASYDALRVLSDVKYFEVGRSNADETSNSHIDFPVSQEADNRWVREPREKSMLALSTYFAVRAGRVLTIDHGDASLSLYVSTAAHFQVFAFIRVSSALVLARNLAELRYSRN